MTCAGLGKKRKPMGNVATPDYSCPPGLLLSCLAWSLSPEYKRQKKSRFAAIGVAYPVVETISRGCPGYPYLLPAGGKLVQCVTHTQSCRLDLVAFWEQFCQESGSHNWMFGSLRTKWRATALEFDSHIFSGDLMSPTLGELWVSLCYVAEPGKHEPLIAIWKVVGHQLATAMQISALGSGDIYRDTT